MTEPNEYQIGRAEDAIAVALEARRVLGEWIANAISDHENGWMDDAEYRSFCYGADVFMRALDFSLEQRRYLRGKLNVNRKRKQE